MGARRRVTRVRLAPHPEKAGLLVGVFDAIVLDAPVRNIADRTTGREKQKRTHDFI